MSQHVRSEQMQLRNAIAADWDRVLLLLEAAGLPCGGLQDQFPQAYWVAIADGQVVGVVGLERYGDYGLLRSLAVGDAWRGRGFGGALATQVLRVAAEEAVAAVFLLTNTAEPFFAGRGFTPVLRANAPAALQAAPEFASICPSSVTCMRWTR